METDKNTLDFIKSEILKHENDSLAFSIEKVNWENMPFNAIKHGFSNTFEKTKIENVDYFSSKARNSNLYKKALEHLLKKLEQIDAQEINPIYDHKIRENNNIAYYFTLIFCAFILFLGGYVYAKFEEKNLEKDVEMYKQAVIRASLIIDDKNFQIKELKWWNKIKYTNEVNDEILRQKKDRLEN